MEEDRRMSKLDEAINAPPDGDPMAWLWSLANAAKSAPRKVPPAFEDAAVAGLARAAAALGEPKNGWGIGFVQVADVGARLLAICPSERLARCVLGLAGLSGIGGDIVTAVRKRSSHEPIAAALGEFDRREEKASTYKAMRKAMIGFADEILPRKGVAKKAAKKSALRLHIVNGRIIRNDGGGAWGAYRKALRATRRLTSKGKDERRTVAPADVPKKEQEQLVGILTTAFGLKKGSFRYADIFSGKSKEETLVELVQTPIEWWDVVDDGKQVKYQLWFYHADCGSLVLAGTSKRVASIIQLGFDVETKDPGNELARAMAAAHAELRKRCPKSELSGVDFQP